MALAVLALLLLALCGCSGASPSPGEPRRYSDDSSSDQCDLPVEQRTGGWFCYEEQ